MEDLMASDANVVSFVVEPSLPEEEDDGSSSVTYNHDDAESQEAVRLTSTPTKKGTDSTTDWSADGTLLLIERYASYKDEFSNGMRKKSLIWKDIAADINESGYSVNGAACDKKMRSLKQRYKLIVADPVMSNRNKNEQWKFFGAMDNVMRNDNCIMPLLLEASLRSDTDANVHWSDSSTLLLIACYKNCKEEFYSGKRKKYEVWKDIASHISKKGYTVNGEACDKKMRSLRQRYKYIKESRILSGRCSAKQWKFYSAMDDLTGSDPLSADEPLLADPSPSASTNSSQPTIHERPKKRRLDLDTTTHTSALDKIAQVAGEKNKVFEKFLNHLTNRHDDNVEYRRLIQKVYEEQQEQMVAHQKEVQDLHAKVFQLLEDQKIERQKHHEEQLRQHDESRKEMKEMQKQFFDMQREYLGAINKLICDKK